ncbi:MAG: Fic family protein [Opitutaceae bacterium]|nr:Fic family protein [Opitutaceae bacterium]
MQLVGTSWLLEHYALGAVLASHRSRIGGRRQRLIKPDGAVEDIFPRNYWPGDHPLDHVEFIFKYENLSLDLLEQVFRKIKAADVDRYLAASPTSKYRRRIGFLYEFLTPDTLKIGVSGNYVPVLDPKKYFTGKPRRSARWRVIDNLLGGAGACPLIRRTPAIDEKLKRDWSREIRRLTRETSPRLWSRAVNYLYLKETKASFAIEREEVTPARGERFVAVLARSGTVPPAAFLDEPRLTSLQNLIVDPRYAAKGFRDSQNYVGQTLPGFQGKVHYVCPPPRLVPTLISGLRTFRVRSEELPAPVRAAVVSFGFVYVHPFADGNGRLHRLLLHESLALDGYTDSGIVLPFSAAMLRDSAAYDRVLETVSRPVNARVRYHLEKDGSLILDNPREAEGVWRYPDLTPHVEYVLELIEATVTRDLPEELQTLVQIDRAAAAIKEIVDLPEIKLNLLLSLLAGNHGQLSRRKRSSTFAELTDAEVTDIEQAFAEAFGQSKPAAS